MNACLGCRRPTHAGTPYCAACIEVTREKLRCPDCRSVVTMVLAEDVRGMYAHIAHDESCPRWRARQNS